MTREELDKKIETTRAENRAALEKADAFIREFNRLASIHAVRTERVFRELHDAARRR
jgi:hypothetical protein